MYSFPSLDLSSSRGFGDPLLSPVPSFLLTSSIPLYEFTTIHLLMDIWVVSSFELL